MAVSGVICRSRLLFHVELKHFLLYQRIVNKRNLFHDTKKKWRQCRKLTTNLLLAEKNTEKVSLVSIDDHINDDDGIGVTINYVGGIPEVTVPLPSRGERCKFSLRPVGDTVGDFLEMLRKEDLGIERTAIHTTNGTRIASSNPIEVLLEDNFRLIINDIRYTVEVPQKKQKEFDKVLVDQQLGDVRDLIHQLYQALNVRDHQLIKERELRSRLEELQLELHPLEEARHKLETYAQRRGSLLAWTGLGLMSVQFGILARLTWWEYSWDIMEPVTYFVTYGTAMAGYAYFVLTKEEYVLPDVKDRQHLLSMHKRARKSGLDLNKYNELKEQIAIIKCDLERLRDPLYLNIPSSKPNIKQIKVTKEDKC